MTSINTYAIARCVAADLVDYWDAVDANDDSSTFAVDNQDVIEAVREAYLALGRALAATKAAGIVVELSDAAARAVLTEAEDRKNLVYNDYREARKAVAAGIREYRGQKKVAGQLYRGYCALLRYR